MSIVVLQIVFFGLLKANRIKISGRLAKYVYQPSGKKSKRKKKGKRVLDKPTVGGICLCDNVWRLVKHRNCSMKVFSIDKQMI
jgi:hypothetical protein